MIHKSTIDFLKKLKKNNNRDWFHANKNLYEDSKYDFEVFIFDLIQKISEYDETISGLEPKDCLFRIYKDVRFSKDKTPYKTNLGASISKGGRKGPAAGYYVHIDPAEYFLGSGLYMPMPEKLLAVRKKIAAEPKKFKSIVENKEFKKIYGKLWEGNALKSAPKGFAKDHPMADYLRLKSFIGGHTVSEEKVLSKGYCDYTAKIFKAIKPLNDFLNKA